jgi:hypothetical protein
MTNEDRKKYLAFLSFTQSEQQNYFGGVMEGVHKNQKSVVLESLKLNLPLSTIAAITKLSEEEVNNIIAEAGKENG